MECLSCPDMTLADWGQNLMAKLGGRRFPLSASFEVTERCNLDCVHCFINHKGGCPWQKSGELSLIEIKTILDQMAEAGVINLLLTGGEVFIRPDFVEIYRYAKRLGMLVMVFTNGTMINERIADHLADLPPYFIEVSTYGHTRETYEHLTRVPGSFDRYRRGIELMIDRGLSLGLKTVLMTINRNEISQMKSFAESLDVPFRYDGMIWPRLDGGLQPLKVRLSPEEVVNLDMEDHHRWTNFIQMHREKKDLYPRREMVYSCGAGYYGFHVSASGQMSMCMMARQPAYDLRGGNLKEGWDFLEAVRNKKRILDTPCQTCKAAMLCTQCPGWSQMVHGDDETPVEYVCEIGHLRLQYTSSIQQS